MDLEGISIIAQIATGAATLAVAIFLASQLRLQHGDSVRETSLNYKSDMMALVLNSQITNAEFSDIYLRGCEDYTSLGKVDMHRFNMFLIMYFNAASSLWVHESGKADPRKTLHNMLQTGPGVVEWWRTIGVQLLDVNFVNFVHKELFERGELKSAIHG